MMSVSTVTDLRSRLAHARRSGRRIGLVPTMGNLHAGHLRLVETARQRTDFVVVSVYVNPMQFGPDEDFAAYPRTPEKDRQALAAAGVEVMFAPTDDEIYPRGMAAQTQVEVPQLGRILCGAFRPGHFRGVTTVVNRLFNLVQPDVAVFGKKDYQQLLLIRLMVADLGIPLEVVGVDTVRESDGLAMSSRNVHLLPEQRRIAPRLFGVLQELREEILRARAIPAAGEQAAMERLRLAGFRPDYVSVRRRDLAQPAAGDRELVILAAARLGATRLIDNVELAIPG
jgi:pantoate--beta-alanine ligase